MATAERLASFVMDDTSDKRQLEQRTKSAQAEGFRLRSVTMGVVLAQILVGWSVAGNEESIAASLSVASRRDVIERRRDFAGWMPKDRG